MRSMLALAAFLHCGWGAPQPGDVYREFHVAMGGQRDWRVTEPQPKNAGALAHLPNSVLRFRALDLAGAVRAEMQIDRWGGHPATTGKRMRINGGEWIALPELTTTPAGYDPIRYMSQDNPIVPIPVSALKEGLNTLEGTAGGQLPEIGFGWGQWGWYGAIVRVYYDPPVKAKLKGRIVSPAAGTTMREDPEIRLALDGAADRVDVLAWYDGYDENGDGVFEDWHHAYRSIDLTGHAGTVTSAPWRVTWDTAWVPDQRPGSIRLMARIRARGGLWFVAPIVDRLSLARRGQSVKLFKPRDVPERFWVRAGKRMSCVIDIPGADLLRNATEAVVAVRTWNGAHERMRVNAHETEIGGADHTYALSHGALPPSALRAGENRIEFHSSTVHHGPEIAWPGPAVLVRFGGRTRGTVKASSWLNPDYEWTIPLEVSTDLPVLSGKAIEVDLNLNGALQKQGMAGKADPATLRAAEYSDSSRTALKDSALPVQVVEGGLVVLLRSAQNPGEKRYLSLYFSREGVGAPKLEWPSEIAVSESPGYQGQDSYRIRTGDVEWVYHGEGAGFASLLDRDGDDWISYRPGLRSAGEFRGIPNLGEVFHPGYEKNKGSVTRIVHQGPASVRLHSESRDGNWAADWDFFASYARLTVRKAPAPYWFLYEGTPGGRLDLESDYWVTSDGARRTMSETWNADLAGSEWLYFGDERKRQVLFLANHQDDSANDQFWQMEGNMTVWGFGRQYRCCGKYLDAVPGVFTVGLSGATGHDRIKAEVESARARPRALVGEAAPRPGLRR